MRLHQHINSYHIMECLFWDPLWLSDTSLLIHFEVYEKSDGRVKALILRRLPHRRLRLWYRHGVPD